MIVGSGIADNGATDMASGEVRGYDAVSGTFRQRFEAPAGGAGNSGGGRLRAILEDKEFLKQVLQ